ncbi:MAG TPA: MMPL family transporter [Actinocrinis sp.]|jgi:RND superfamily putative drug exporter
MRTHGGIAARVAAWSVRRRKIVVVGWLALVVLVSLHGSIVKTVDASTTQATVGQSGQALRILQQAGLTPPAAESVLIQSGTETSTDPAFKAAVADVVSELGTVPAAVDVTSPYKASGLISADGRSALVTFNVTGSADTADSRITPALHAVGVAAAKNPGFSISEVGDASAAQYLNTTFNSDFAKAEWTAVPVALIILLLAFGTLVAASLPVILALTAYMMAAGFMAQISHALPTTSDAGSVMLLVGLAVGVDYCLFFLRRSRTERAAGRSVEESIAIAAQTSGRTILISGLTVAAAMAGMFLTRMVDFEAIALSTIVVIVIAVIGAITVLPALMAMLGDKVDKGRIPVLGRMRQAQIAAAATGGPVTPRGWRGLMKAVLGKPATFAVGTVVVLLALAVPLLSMHTAQLSTPQELEPGTGIVTTTEAIAAAFPGSDAPATIVVTTPDPNGSAVTAATQQFEQQALASGKLFDSSVVVHADKGIVEVYTNLAGTGTDPASNAALAYLRSDLLPQTYGQVPGTHTYVAGVTAQSADFDKQLDNSVLPVFGFVLVLAFLLMLSSFRSLTIAVGTVLLNLLSVGAAYGVLTLVFQHNVGEQLVGAHPVGAINAWVPLFLFVLLFGLSMDYHVFVISRITEGRRRGLSARQAIAEGIGSTAGVISSAALIMVGVFAIFATLSVESMKQVAVGLAVAVFIDATIIRALLLPALMTLLGDANWYLPRWLNWVPQLSHGEVQEPGEHGADAARALESVG